MESNEALEGKHSLRQSIIHVHSGLAWFVYNAEKNIVDCCNSNELLFYFLCGNKIMQMKKIIKR